MSAVVEVGPSGSSDVTLAFFADKEAADVSKKVTGKPLLSMLDFQPLTATGWSFLSTSSSLLRPRWVTDSVVLYRRVNRPQELSSALASIAVGGAPVFDGFELESRNRVLFKTYTLKGTVRLPSLEVLLPPLPSALSDTIFKQKTSETSPQEPSGPPLELEIEVRMPGRASVLSSYTEARATGFVWRVMPGETREVFIRSETLETSRIALWSLSFGSGVVAVAFYIAARRRRASTSLRT